MARTISICAIVIFGSVLVSTSERKSEDALNSDDSTVENAIHKGNIKSRTLYDYQTRIVAFKDLTESRCILEFLKNGETFLSQNFEKAHFDKVPKKYFMSGNKLSKRQIWNLGGQRISEFCRGFPTFLIQDLDAIDQDDNVLSDFPDTSLQRRKRSTKHFFVGRVRGQTQSQYLNFGNSKDPGKAEAESTYGGSKAIVSGSSGMGQAQSQSSPYGCEECYGQGEAGQVDQQQVLHYGRTGASQLTPSEQYQQPGGNGHIGTGISGQDQFIPGQESVGGRDRLGPSDISLGGRPGQIPGTHDGRYPVGPNGRPGQESLGPGQTQYPGGQPGTISVGPDGRPGEVSLGPGQTQYPFTPGGQPGRYSVGPDGRPVAIPSTPGQTQYPLTPGGQPGRISVGPDGRQTFIPDGPGGPAGQISVGPDGRQTYLPSGTDGRNGHVPVGPDGRVAGPGTIPGQGEVGADGQPIISGQPGHVGQGRIRAPGQPTTDVYGRQETPIGSVPGFPGERITAPQGPVQYPGAHIPDYEGRPDVNGYPTYPYPGYPSQRITTPTGPQVPGYPGETTGARHPDTQSRPGYPGQYINGQHPGQRYPGQQVPGYPGQTYPGYEVEQIDKQRGTQGTVDQGVYDTSRGGKFGGQLTGGYDAQGGQRGKFSGVFSGEYEAYQNGKLSGRYQQPSYPGQGYTIDGRPGATTGGGTVGTGGQAGTDGGYPGYGTTQGGSSIGGPGVPQYQSGIPGGQLVPGQNVYGPGGHPAYTTYPGYPAAQVGGNGGQIGAPGGQIGGPGAYIEGGQIGVPTGQIGTPGVQIEGGGGQTGGPGRLTGGQIRGPGGLIGGHGGQIGTPGAQIQGGGGQTGGPGRLVGGQIGGPGGLIGGHGGQIGVPGMQIGTPGSVGGQIGEPGAQFGGPGGQIGGPGGQLVGSGGQIGGPGGQLVGPGGQIGGPGGQLVGPEGQIGGPGGQLIGPGGQIGLPAGQIARPGGQIGYPGGSDVGQIQNGYPASIGSGAQYGIPRQNSYQIPGGQIGTGGQQGQAQYPTGQYGVPGQPGYPGTPGQQTGIPGQIGYPASIGQNGRIEGGAGQYGPSSQTGYPGVSGGGVGTGPGGGVIGVGGQTGIPGYTLGTGGTGAGAYYDQYNQGALPEGQVDDSDSQSQTSVQQTNNETQASASAQGRFGGGTSQSQVSGTYTGTGSFSAAAGSDDGKRGALTQVSGGKEGALSSAQGRGGLGQSQSQVQLSSDTGDTLSSSQTGGWNHGSQTQVQASGKGGMADAQANGPGSTSSQAQIGFTPYDDAEKDDQTTPFRGGGMASAQSGTYSGQAQSQIQGKFRYGIKYTGAAQAGSGSKDTVALSRNQTRPLGLSGTFPEFKPLTFTAARPQTEQTSLTQSHSKKSIRKSSLPDADQTNTAPPPMAPDVEDSVTDDYNDEEYDYDNDRDAEQSTDKPVPKSIISQKSKHQRQHIVLDPLEELDATVQQSYGDFPKDGAVLQPGQHIPGSPGYQIPQGFRGRVKSIASGPNTYALGKHSQAQSVTLTPGTGRIIYRRPVYAVASKTHSTNGQYGFGSGYTYQPISYQVKSGKSLPNFMSVTKSETGSKDPFTGEKTPSVYYSQSSSCGVFTNSCVFNGSGKLCFPKPKTNPDGTLVAC